MIRKTIPPLVLALLLTGCVSGEDQNQRNSDIFSEARRLAYDLYREGNYENFDGNIQDLITFIDTQGTTEVSPTPDPFEIEGIVTVPSSFGFGLASSATQCSLYSVYSRSFVLQDQNTGILVAYGLEPPSTDVAEAASMKYINNARNPNMAVFGDRIRLRVKKVQKYGSTNTIPVITDFEIPEVISSRNSVRYSVPTAAFSRNDDLNQVRRITGFVTTSPSYVECGSSTPRQFQYEHQTGYSGVLCVGATSAADAEDCTGGKTPYNFKMSHNLGAGTLSGFDTGDMFSYTLAKGAYVRLTGPVIVARYNGDDSLLTLLLDQKHQVETLTAP